MMEEIRKPLAEREESPRAAFERRIGVFNEEARGRMLAAFNQLSPDEQGNFVEKQMPYIHQEASEKFFERLLGGFINNWMMRKEDGVPAPRSITGKRVASSRPVTSGIRPTSTHVAITGELEGDK